MLGFSVISSSCFSLSCFSFDVVWWCYIPWGESCGFWRMARGLRVCCLEMCFPDQHALHTWLDEQKRIGRHKWVNFKIQVPVLVRQLSPPWERLQSPSSFSRFLLSLFLYIWLVCLSLDKLKLMHVQLRWGWIYACSVFPLPTFMFADLVVTWTFVSCV